MAETSRGMSRKLSKSRPNLYERMRGSLSRGLAGSRAEKTEALKQATLDLVAQALDARDLAIARHSVRVAELAARLTQQLDLGRPNVELIRMAGMLHDLGVIGVRDDVLNKPGPLDDDEWEIMRRHSDIGADMIRWHPALAVAAPLVRHHHERWDGAGYCSNLSGDAIPIEGRIVAVADVFDALTHDRPYKTAWTLSDARAEIVRCSGTQFDPRVVEAFLGVVYSWEETAVAA